ncbi:MAG: radical SAM protein, partial [Candidatus Hydrogenedentes bacterium]|nr:radical SAM protein [Candidatus Hydrogenedentota bacterium]
ALNPEPMAAFIDAFVVGDGEEVIVEIAECLRAIPHAPRRERLEALDAIAGVFVPSLHGIATQADGAVVSDVGRRIVRRTVTALDDAPAPEAYLVPFVQLVHDRVGIEIMRGCAHGCRFCQAGMIGRPVRTRSLETIDRLMDDTLRQTGYEEVSLLSLSSCDYPEARALFTQSARRAHADDAAVSAPSLRLDTFAVELADAISGVRRSGLTFAPEAATPRLRAVINKNFDDETLFRVVEEAIRRGWEHVKCYFMIGLPTETDEDVEAIIELCRAMLARAKHVNRRARITTGVSTFVPKPFSPFQWAGQIGFDEIRRRQSILHQGFKRLSAVKFGYHEAESSFVEGLIARGDRRTGSLIESAFRHGARLDSSSDLLDMRAWYAAIEETGYPVDAMLGERALDARLPWDYVDVGVDLDWLKAEWGKALDGAETPDCRWAACNHCGVRADHGDGCREMQSAWNEARDDESGGAPVVLEAHEEPAPAQRVRFRVGRLGEARFLSNHEWMTAWIRAL